MKFPTLNLKFLSSFSYGNRINPFRDWFVLISIALVLFLLSAAWNAWLFYRVYNGETLQSTTATTTSAVSTAPLTKAEEVFATRAAEEARYRSEYRFVDPSK